MADVGRTGRGDGVPRAAAAGVRRRAGRDVCGGYGPVCMPVCCREPSPTRPPYRLRRGLSTMGNYLGKHSRSLRRHKRHERRPSCTHTGSPVTAPCRSTWGRAQAATPPGVAANSGPLVDVSSFYCELCSADGPSPCTLVLGALSSSPVHRALVLVLGTNIAVLLKTVRSRLETV